MALKQEDILTSKYYTNNLAIANTDINLRSGPGTKYTIIKTCSKNEPTGYIKAYYRYKADGNTWYLLRLYKTIGNRQTAWVSAPYINYKENKTVISASSTKKMLRQLIDNDVIIYQRLITAMAIAHNCRKNGIDTYDIDKTILQLTQRYNERQLMLRESPALRTKKWLDKTFLKLQTWLTVQNIATGMGVAPIFIAAATGAAVGITATLMTYYIFRPKYDESTRDLQISKNLKNILDNLPEQQRLIITKNLEKQIDKAYRTGQTAGFFSTSSKLIKYGLIAIGIYTAYNIVQQQQFTQKISKRL